MSFSLAVLPFGSPCLLLLWLFDSPSSHPFAPDWITAISTAILAAIGLLAIFDYRKRKKQEELLKLDSRLLWWFIIHPGTYAETAPNLAAALGRTLDEIMDSLQRLSMDGKLHVSPDGETWSLNRAVIMWRK